MTQVKMPEPAMRIYAEGAIRTVTEWRDGARDLPDGDHDLITTTQAEAYADAKVREALEEAAGICWEMQSAPEFGKDDKDHWLDIAERRIRALIPPLPGPVEPSKENT